MAKAVIRHIRAECIYVPSSADFVHYKHHNLIHTTFIRT